MITGNFPLPTRNKQQKKREIDKTKVVNKSTVLNELSCSNNARNTQLQKKATPQKLSDQQSTPHHYNRARTPTSKQVITCRY